MRKRTAKVTRAAANLALKNVARVTWRETGGEDKTIFVNFATMRLIPLPLWGEVNVLMRDLPHQWVVSTVIKVRYHSGSFYKSEEYAIDQMYKLATLYDVLEEMGQAFIDQQRANLVEGIGAVITQTKGAELSTEKAAALVELAHEKGYTNKEIEHYARSFSRKR